MREARTNLSRLAEQAAEGEAFIIARAGKPLVKVVPLDARDLSKPRRLGFLAGAISVPDNFDRMGQNEIERLFSTST